MRKRCGVALAVVLLVAALTAGACGRGDNGGVIKGTPAGVTTTTARPGYG